MRIVFSILLMPLLCAAVYIAARIVSARRLLFWREAITPMSVKESLDTLPTALCCYWPDGLVKLSNTRMNELCLALTGAALSDAAAFWDALYSGTVAGARQGGNNPIAVLPDGTTVSFRRSELVLEGAPIFELSAVDISEEYRLSLELAEQERYASAVNRRLIALRSRIKYVMMDKEALAMKIRVHDQIGRGLLMARRYIAKPGSVPREELLRIWRTNILLLQNEEPEAWQESYFTGMRYAEALGVALTTEGELPREPRLAGIVSNAICAHLTNVLRHAHGKSAHIAVFETRAAYTIDFTNDGDPPGGEIRETGGLADLRRETEAAGGAMDICGAPRFRLRLILPKEEDDHGISGIDRGGFPHVPHGV